MRQCQENDSRITDQPPGGGYSQEDVLRGKYLNVHLPYNSIVYSIVWAKYLYIFFAHSIMEIYAFF
jgi:hypothetical protein